MERTRLPVVVLVLAVLAVGGTALLDAGAVQADTEGARPKLEAHPLQDAKPGEYLRFMRAEEGWKKWYIERIIDVREGEVLWEIYQTNEDGTKDTGAVRKGWKKIPKLKAAPHQKVIKDVMEEMEVAGQKLWCRHFTINEREFPDFPEPRRRKDVWYSNDIPCSGKVKDTVENRIVTSWGMMSEEELKKRQKAYEDAEKSSGGS
jgi:hypothetical protein